VFGGENLKKRDYMGDLDLHWNNITVNLKGMGWEDMDRIYLA
jgi:hypothetical protein